VKKKERKEKKGKKEKKKENDNELVFYTRQQSKMKARKENAYSIRQKVLTFFPSICIHLEREYNQHNG
jgi:hypothetical protein